MIIDNLVIELIDIDNKIIYKCPIRVATGKLYKSYTRKIEIHPETIPAVGLAKRWEMTSINDNKLFEYPWPETMKLKVNEGTIYEYKINLDDPDKDMTFSVEIKPSRRECNFTVSMKENWDILNEIVDELNKNEEELFKENAKTNTAGAGEKKNPDKIKKLKDLINNNGPIMINDAWGLPVVQIEWEFIFPDK